MSLRTVDFNHNSNQITLTMSVEYFLKLSSWIKCNKADLLPPYIPTTEVMFHIECLLNIW